MIKTINLILEDTGLSLESDGDSGLVTIRLNNFVFDEEKSTESNKFYNEKDVVEVYPSVDEVKEIIKALQQVLPEEDEHE